MIEHNEDHEANQGREEDPLKIDGNQAKATKAPIHTKKGEKLAKSATGKTEMECPDYFGISEDSPQKMEPKSTEVLIETQTCGLDSITDTCKEEGKAF